MGKKARELDGNRLSCFFYHFLNLLLTSKRLMRKTRNKYRTKVRFLYTFPLRFATIEHNNF